VVTICIMSSNVAVPHQESEEMDGPNQSLPHHANAAHFLECSQGHKHVQKRDSDLHQDKHSQVKL
jgi:hypothetical protein